MNVKDRLLLFISEQGMSKSVFERRVGLSNGYLNNFKGRLGDDKLNGVLSAFPELSKVWLLTGEGEMLRSGSTQSGAFSAMVSGVVSGSDNRIGGYHVENKPAVAGSASGDVTQIGGNRSIQISGGHNTNVGNSGIISSGGRNTYNVGRGRSAGASPTEPDTYSTNQKGRGVPYFDVDFTMGFDLLENDQTINPEYHIDFPQYNKADCWVNATGKSMSPLIEPGDKVAIKRITDWADNILYGEVYAVVTDDHRTIKKIRKSPKGDDYLRFVPENTAEFDAQDVHKQTIIGVYRVLGCAKLMS
ncbi:MAG: hypothetical protein LBV18_04235 [Alistipes sp.]|jgi:SOS-response transcriptional repressor LexA|nr:hypothetical protein [Alistipes sp.]